MPRIEMDLNPVLHITADAIGQPGQRVFYIQGRTEDSVVTVIVEKVQIQTLALGIENSWQSSTSAIPNCQQSPLSMTR